MVSPTWRNPLLGGQDLGGQVFGSDKEKWIPGHLNDKVGCASTRPPAAVVLRAGHSTAHSTSPFPFGGTSKCHRAFKKCQEEQSGEEVLPTISTNQSYFVFFFYFYRHQMVLIEES